MQSTYGQTARGVHIAEFRRVMITEKCYGVTRLPKTSGEDGPVYQDSLRKHGNKDMGDIARMSLEDEDWLCQAVWCRCGDSCRPRMGI